MALNLKKDIIGVTEFRSNMGETLTRVEQTKRPVVLTKGGRPSVVVLDVQSYQEMLDALETLEEANRRELLEGVKRAEADIEAGRTRSHAEAMKEQAKQS